MNSFKSFCSLSKGCAVPPCEFECDIKSLLRGQGAIKRVIGALGILKRGVDLENSFRSASLAWQAGSTQGFVGRRQSEWRVLLAA